MDVEWDEEKRQRNLRERGLDFADVVRFEFATAITEQDRRRDYGEARFNTWGYLDGVFCSLCWDCEEQRIPCHLFEEMQ